MMPNKFLIMYFKNLGIFHLFIFLTALLEWCKSVVMEDFFNQIQLNIRIPTFIQLDCC